MSLTIQAISSHPLLIHAVEEVLADVKEHPHLPTVSNEGEATNLTAVARLFLLDACSLQTDIGPLAERCRASSPGSRFITLLPPADYNYGHEIRLFYWGIDGFVELSETWRTELPQAIRCVLGGQYWVRPEVLAAFVRHAQVLEQARLLRGNSLTAREAQILRLLIRHLTNKEISRQLAISERTVKFHVSHILAKFGLDDRRGLLPEACFGRPGGVQHPGQRNEAQREQGSKPVLKRASIT
jgi:DNA-binding NarL/FixJ family response regulator